MNINFIYQGRRIAKEDTVENPTFWEIRDVLKDCGLQIWIENKVCKQMFSLKNSCLNFWSFLLMRYLPSKS